MLPFLSLRASVAACALMLAAAGFAQPLRPDAPPQSGPASRPAAPAKAIGRTAVTVGSVAIKTDRIDTLVELMARARGAEMREVPAEQAAAMRRMVAASLIGQELLELEARAGNTQASPRETDSTLKALKDGFSSPEEWRRAMQRSGETEAGMRGKIARQIRANKVLAANMKQPSMPTEAELRAFWDKNRKEFPVNDSLRALQILLLADAKTPAEAALEKKRRLEAIRRDLSADTAETTVLLRRFMDEAARAGEGPEARIGGDLERFHPDDFHPDFKQQIQKLRVGEFSPVFRTPLGFHLVLLIEKFDGRFENYRLQSLQNLMVQRNLRLEADMRVFLKKLAAKYPVKYVLPEYRDTSENGIY